MVGTGQVTKVEDKVCATLLDIVRNSVMISADRVLAVKDVIMKLRDFTEEYESRTCLHQIDQIMYHVVFTLDIHQHRIHELKSCALTLRDRGADYFKREAAVDYIRHVLAFRGRRFQPSSLSRDPLDFSALVPPIEATDRIRSRTIDDKESITEPPVILDVEYINLLKSKVQQLKSADSLSLRLKECITPLESLLEYTASTLRNYESMIRKMKEILDDGSKRVSGHVIDDILSELPIFAEGKARLMFRSFNTDTSGAQLTSVASTSPLPPIRAPASRYRIKFAL